MGGRVARKARARYFDLGRRIGSRCPAGKVIRPGHEAICMVCDLEPLHRPRLTGAGSCSEGCAFRRLDAVLCRSCAAAYDQLVHGRFLIRIQGDVSPELAYRIGRWVERNWHE